MSFGLDIRIDHPDNYVTLDLILSARDREAALPMLGSVERPYELIVPGWFEDRCIEQGTTAQAEADKLFRYATHVTVV